MLLALDIGNTNVVAGVYQGSKWIHQWRVDSNPKRPAKNYEIALGNYLLEKNIKPNQIERTIISSVVPELNEIFIQVVKSAFLQDPYIIGPQSYSRLKIGVGNPEEIGTDLVANAVAAFQKCKGYCIVVDFGTALTFTTISSDGSILGVSIAPGLRTALKALSDNTAKLPEIHLEMPKSAIGKSTVHALQAGLLFGFKGLVEAILDQTTSELGKECTVIATGGLASVIKPLKKRFDLIDPCLTLEGIRLIEEQNR